MKNLSLKIKLPVMFGMLLFVLVSISNGILYGYYYRTFMKSFQETMGSTMEANAQSYGNLIGEIDKAIKVVNDNETAFWISGNNHLSEYISVFEEYHPKNRNLKQALEQNVDNKVNFQNLFKAVLGTTNNLSVTLYFSQEYPLSVYYPGGSSMTDSVFRSDRDLQEVEWYQQTVQREGDYYWFLQEENPEKIFVAKLLTYQKVNSKYEYSLVKAGVICLSFDAVWLEQWQDSSEFSQNMQIFVVNDEEQILYQSGDLNGKAALAMLKKMESADGQSKYQEYGAVHYLTQKNEIGAGLCMLSIAPLEELKEMTGQMLTIILVVLVCVLLIGTVLILIFSHYFLQPIIRLTDQMNEGKLQRVEENNIGGNEIDMLYRSYNEMQRKIEDMFLEIEENAEKKKNAELRALQLQINPHFVFNTLSSIACAALLADQDQIARQLNVLAEILRYNLRQPTELVSIQEEIKIIHCYEWIQQISCAASIQFTYHIMPECEQYQIPKLMLQPLVENSIAYGTNEEDDTVWVDICVRENQKGVLEILVTDSGTDAKIEQMNRYIRGECEMNTEHQSLGVRNVYERVKLFFGENGDFSYYKNENGNTVAVITISMSEKKRR